MRFGRAKHIAPPAAVRLALERIFGDSAPGVEQVRVIERSWFARLHGRAIATTRRRRIFLRGSAAEFFSDPTLMLHEYCHVLRQWEPRSLTTLRYVGECLRRGYWNNRFEIEARHFAHEHAERFCQILYEERPTKPLSPASRALRINLGSAPQPSSDSRR